jgi:hypothetical protein
MSLGSKEFALHSDEISDIECFKELKSRIADDIPLEVSLDSSFSILNLDKTGFAKVTDRHDPTPQAEGFFNRFQFFVREGAESLMKIFRGMGHPEIVWVGIDPILSQGLQFFDPLLDQFTRFVHLLCPER